MVLQVLRWLKMSSSTISLIIFYAASGSMGVLACKEHRWWGFLIGLGSAMLFLNVSVFLMGG